MKRSLLALGIICVCLTSQAYSQTSPARAFLEKVFSNDPEMRKKLPMSLLALRATKDTDLLPIFQAIGKCKDKAIRRLAPSAIMTIAGDDAAKYLTEMLNDSTPEIQAEVVVYLASLDTNNDEFKQYLIKTLSTENENLQCLAARTVVKLGIKDEKLAKTLQNLAKSASLTTSSMAKMALLALGDSSHHDQLAKMLNDEKTDKNIIGLLLEEIRDLEISAAQTMVTTLTENKNLHIAIHLNAYQTLAKIAPDSSEILSKAILSAPQPLPIYLMGMLGKQKNASEQFKTLSNAPEPISSLAKFELARLSGNEDMQQVAWAAMKPGHPAVVAYIASRGETDLKNKSPRTSHYVKPLIAYLLARQESQEIAANEGLIIERVTTLLVDIGTKEAVAGLRYFLATKHGLFLKAAASGLVQANNKIAAQLAKPLLASPYNDISSYAAFATGKFADPAAAENLKDMLAHPDRHRESILTYAAWYLLKIEGVSAKVAKDIATKIK